MTGPSGEGRELGACGRDEDDDARDASEDSDMVQAIDTSTSTTGAPANGVRLARVTEPDRPTIRLQVDDLRPIVVAAVDALARHDATIFQRGGELVTIATEPDRERYEGDRRRGGRIETRPGTPSIVALPAAALRTRLSTVARWEKWDGRKGSASEDGKRAGGWAATTPDAGIVAAVGSRATLGGWRGIRALDGIAEAPYLAPGGDVVQAPGYDAASRTLYVPGARFPRVAEAPTRDDAARALAELREVFADFPFREGADRDVPIAAILTLLARPAIAGAVPMFCFDASTRGSGKSLLADCVAMVATGRAAPRMSWPTIEEEQEKVLGAYAFRGANLIAFDNATAPICGAPLDKVLTATGDVDLRVLGQTHVPSFPWRAVVFATGNNLTIAGDTERRTLLARLEPREENPEEREDFAHPDLLAWLHVERPRLVVAALTILRGYIVAGRPRIEGIKSWGSFEAWTALVPRALAWASGANVLECRPTTRGEGDPDRAVLRAVLDAWPRLDPSAQGITIRSVLALLYSPDRMRGEAPPDGFDDLREALETVAGARSGQGVDAKAAGKVLRRLRGRWQDGRRLESVDGHGGVQRWKVMIDKRPAPPPSTPPSEPPASEPPTSTTRPAEPAAADVMRLIPMLGADDLASLTEHNDPAVREAARAELAARLAAERGGPS